MKRISTVATLILLLTGCGTTGSVQESPEIAFLNATPPGNFPFSEAVRVGDLLFLSGQIGIDRATGALVPGGIEAETRKTMDGIKATVERYGSSMNRVVKCTVMLADMREWPAMNAVYATYFTENKPARSALGANGLALGARVEIECIAALE